MSFSTRLIRWYEANGRSLPWRGIDDPYRIWLSEVILQQTRIEQGLSYYKHFTERYPTVTHLADASEEEVLKSWQGLGYYSRARNLHTAARQIVERHGGRFPDCYDDILALKGVGRYTAAAIASFAFRLPYPVIDGNVYRVAARHFGIATPIGNNTAYSEFERVLLGVMDRERPNLFNQAIMDFGSLWCKPVGCDCKGCIFADSCEAWRHGKVELLPVKEPPATVRDRWFYYFDIEWTRDGLRRRLMQRRTDKDIWQGLYELPLEERPEPLETEALRQLAATVCQRYSSRPPRHVEEVATTVHKLTHQNIHATFVHVILADAMPPPSGPTAAFTDEEVKKLPVSRLIDKYLTKTFENCCSTE